MYRYMSFKNMHIWITGEISTQTVHLFKKERLLIGTGTFPVLSPEGTGIQEDKNVLSRIYKSN